MKVQRNIMIIIEYKQLMWFGHVRKMADQHWPKKIWNWQPPEKRKRGRPPRSWIQEIRDIMEVREEDDCVDRGHGDREARNSVRRSQTRKIHILTGD